MAVKIEHCIRNFLRYRKKLYQTHNFMYFTMDKMKYIIASTFESIKTQKNQEV